MSEYSEYISKKYFRQIIMSSKVSESSKRASIAEEATETVIIEYFEHLS